MINHFSTSAGMPTTPLKFTLERLEIADTDLPSRAAAEGFDYVLQSVAYSIRSGESESITDLEGILEYMDATSEDFSDEQYRAGYEYGVEYVQNILVLARHIG